MSATPYVDYRQFFISHRNRELVQESPWRRTVFFLFHSTAARQPMSAANESADDKGADSTELAKDKTALPLQQEIQQQSESLKSWLQRKRQSRRNQAGGPR